MFFMVAKCDMSIPRQYVDTVLEEIQRCKQQVRAHIISSLVPRGHAISVTVSSFLRFFVLACSFSINLSARIRLKCVSFSVSIGDRLQARCGIPLRRCILFMLHCFLYFMSPTPPPFLLHPSSSLFCRRWRQQCLRFHAKTVVSSASI